MNEARIDWVAAGRVMRVPALLPESGALWAEKLYAVELGRHADALSDLAFQAWCRRWWRDELGRGRRMWHYVRAAAAQCADVHMTDLAIMPLGAWRGAAPKSGERWEPGEKRAGDWLAILPIFARTLDCMIVVELLAWHPDKPDRWWHHTGALRVLGAVAAETALAAGEPVRIYATPRRWNRAGGGGAPGCCVLDWRDPLARSLLAYAPALIGDDPRQARDLQRRVDAARPQVKYVLPAGAAA